MADVAPPAYPTFQQPQQAQTNMLANPGQAIGLLNGIQDYRLKQQQFDALAQQPGAVLQGQNISNATAEMQQQEAASRAVSRIMGGYLAGIPKPTDDDVRSAAAFAARSLPNVAVKYPDIISAASETGRRNPGLLINSGLSPEGQSTEVPGTPTPEGQSTIIKMPASNMGIGRVTSLPSGQVEVLAANKKAYTEDQERSASTQANLRKLETVYPLVQQLSNSNFGPGSAEFAKVKGALTTAGVINPNTSDLQVRQEVGKYLLNYAQGAQNAGRSDHALSTAIGSNPNLDLTQPANLALIRNQIGMDKADAAIPVLFHQLHPNPDDKSGYNTFKANFYRNYDLRAFTYDKMSPNERRQLIESLGAKNSPAYKKFAQTYSELKGAGFITPNGQ